MRISDWSSDVCSSDLIQEHRHRAEVERAGADPHQVVEDPRHLVEQRADPLRAFGRLDPHQAFDRKHVGVLVAHHRHVVEPVHVADRLRSEEHTSELQSLMRISYAVSCLTKKKNKYNLPTITHTLPLHYI